MQPEYLTPLISRRLDIIIVKYTDCNLIKDNCKIKLHFLKDIRWNHSRITIATHVSNKPF